MTSVPRTYTRPSSGLVRQLRWWDVLFITIAGPTGSGILYYSVRTSGQPGGSIGLAFIIGAILFLPFVLSSLLLVAAMPRSGGPYLGVSRFVHPLVGYISALLLVVGDSLVIGILGFLVIAVASGMCLAVGQAHGIEILLFIGRTLQGNYAPVIGGLSWVAFFWILMLQKPKYFRFILRTFLAIPLLAAAATVVALFSTNTGQLTVAFDALWGPGTWDAVIESARGFGWAVKPFSWDATLGLLLVVVWAFNGIEIASYAGGEVQSPRSSYAKGLIFGWISVALLYVVMAIAVRHGFGDFIEAYDFMFTHHKDQLATIMPAIDPSIPFYVLCLVGDPIVAALLALAFIMWFVKIIPAAFIATSRLLFSVAMDRLLPEFVADVNPRTASPTWSTHIAGLIAVCGVFFYFFEIGTVLSTIMFCTMFMAWAVGLATFRISRARPELLPVQWLRSGIGPVNVAGILGLLTVASGIILLYLTTRDLTWDGWLVLGVIVGLLLLNYSWRRRVLRRESSGAILKGGDLPPE